MVKESTSSAKKTKRAEKQHIKNRQRVQTAEGWKRMMEKIQDDKKKKARKKT